ncbi:MAG: hypothetical protein OXC44_00645 [Proteobacteria bacterium]|nr:hypothetical protein [Pseudomonadota bacterium]
MQNKALSLIKYVVLLCLMVVTTAGQASAKQQYHRIGNFYLQLAGTQFSLQYGTDQGILEPWVMMPSVQPVKLIEQVHENHVTKRPRFKKQTSYNSLGSYMPYELKENAFTFTLPVIGGCEGDIYLTFSQKAPQSIDVIAEHRDQKTPQRGDIPCNGISLTFSRQLDEHFVGLGTQVTHLDLRGHRFVSLSQEQGHGRGVEPLTWFSNTFLRGLGGDSTTSYHYVPHIISRLGRSFWFYDRDYATFDFTNPSYASVTSTKSTMHFRLNRADHPKKLLQLFGQEFGVTKRLPQWVHRGAMMGLQGGEDMIDHAMSKLKDVKAHVSSLWIQDWVGVRNTFLGQRLLWQWHIDRHLYPHWEQFVRRYNDQGIPVLSYFNPRFTNDCTTTCHFNVAENNEFLVQGVNGLPRMIKNGGFEFAKIDLSHQDAKQWFASLMRKRIQEAPIKGWMADFSESLPFDAVMKNGSLGKDYHHHYIYEWIKLNGQMIDEVDDGFVFARSGVLGSHRYVHGFWLGDQLSTWDKYDGLHSTVIGLISSGLSGALVNHSDIGGLTSLRIPLVAHVKRTKHLFLRWMQMNAFTPIFRTHEGLWPGQSHHFHSDRETLEQFAQYSRIYAALFDYRETLVEETQSQALPLVRGLFLEYPQDQHTWQIDDQFMLGSDLMIAPVLDPSSTTRRLYLPSGHWVEVFSQKEYIVTQPGYIELNVNKDSIPVFAQWSSDVASTLMDVIEREGLSSSSL